MPTYQSKCHECGKTYDYIRKIADYLSTPSCCGVSTTKHMTASGLPQLNPVTSQSFQAYKCPVTDKVVTSSVQKREIEARNDLIIKEPGMFKKRKPRAKSEELPDVLKPALEKATADANKSF